MKVPPWCVGKNTLSQNAVYTVRAVALLPIIGSRLLAEVYNYLWSTKERQKMATGLYQNTK